MNGWLNSQVYIPFASIVSRAPSWGRNLIGNFVAGMDSSASNLSSEVTKLTNLVEAQFRKNLGIASPSKVTFGIGRFVMQGLINGMSSVDIQKFTKKQMDALIGSMGTSGGNATGWLTAALFATGTPMSWLPGLQRLAQAESSGNPLARNSKSVGGEHATGLLQTLPSTFRGYANPGMGNILNPVHNAAAAINYIKSRYGSVYNTPLFHSNGAYVGYADGGFADRPSIFGEAGMEAAIPIRPGNQRSIGLLNKTAQMLGIQPQEQDMREGLNFDTLFSRLFETRSESSNEPNIVINANFAPVIHGVNKTEIMPALKEQEQSFLGELEEIVRRVIKSEKHDRERVAYG
jgi:SLT domain-containing protein